MPIAGQEETKKYRSYAASSGEHIKEVTKEGGIFERRMKKQQDEIDAAAKAREEEEESKGLFGWLATIGSTVGCMAMTAGASTPFCLKVGTAVGAGTRGLVDYFGDAEDYRPDDISFSDAKYNKSVWSNVADELNVQVDSLIEFDENVWKQDLLKQAGDTFTAYSWATGLKSAGAFGDKAVEEGIKKAIPEVISETKSGSIFPSMPEIDLPKINLPHLPDLLEIPTNIFDSALDKGKDLFKLPNINDLFRR